MPIKKCSKDNKPGYKYGDSGACYTYTPGNESSRKKAYDKARKQGQAIEISKHTQAKEDVKKYFKE